jgi:hypothetical protein
MRLIPFLLLIVFLMGALITVMLSEWDAQYERSQAERVRDAIGHVSTRDHMDRV